ncbi:MAG: ABC transporter permease [Acidobacteriota bacterium]
MSFFSELGTILRGLRRSPGYTAAVVVTLALGLGANASIFSVVDAILLRDLPYEDAEQVFRLRERTKFSQSTPLSPHQFLTLRQGVAEWAEIEVLDSLVFHLIGDDGAERVAGAAVSPGFFGLLGVRPILGRDLTPAPVDGEPVAEVLIAHALWQSRFGGAPNVLGRELEMTWSAAFGPRRDLAERFTIVGVLPQDFLPPYGSGELFVPAALPRDEVPRDFNYLFPFARLHDRDPRATEAAMSRMVAAMSPPPWRSQEDQAQVGVALQRVGEASVSRVRSALWILWSAVGLVLVAACANVANLMLTRNTLRRREIGVRLALGASRWRLWRWLLGEALVLAAGAATLGLGLAWGVLRLLHALSPSYLPRLDWIAVDQRLLAFALLAALATAVLFGVLPAMLASRISWSGLGLRSATSNRPARRLGAGLVVVQVALSVLLVACAAHLVHSFRTLLEVDLGFDVERLVTFEVALPAARYPEREQREGFQRQVLGATRSLPGVRSADATSGLPLTLLNTATPLVLPAGVDPGDRPPQTSYRQVSAEYFQTLGVPLLAGRFLEPRDMAQGPEQGPRSILINRGLAEQYWPDRSPIGDVVSLTAAGVEDATIVGVVGDIRQSGPLRDPRPMAFLPSLGSPSFGVVLRLDQQAMVTRADLARTVAAIDPGQPIHAFRTFDSPQDVWLGRPMFNAWVMSFFGGLALLVSVLGLLAVLSFSVSQRTAEIGIRQALGARAGDVLQLIARQGLWLVITGAALGIGLAIASARLIANLLHGTSVNDPVVLAAAVLVALLVAAPAILLPARRAAAIAPVEALRTES